MCHAKFDVTNGLLSLDLLGRREKQVAGIISKDGTSRQEI